MVEVNPPLLLDGQCYTWTDFRHVFDSIICVDGIVGPTDLLVTAAGGGSINVNVAAGSAWVEGSLNGAQGMYLVTNGASKAVTISANGAGSPRIDLIIASVYDSQYIGGVDQWALEIVAGVAGGGVPAVPVSTRSGYVILGEVTVPASGGTPSVVADVRQRMHTCGTAPRVHISAGGTTTNLTTALETMITLDTIVYVDEEFFDTSTPNRVTILQDGIYDVEANLRIVMGGAAGAEYTLYVNNVDGVIGTEGSSAATPGNWAVPTTTLMFPFSAGDYLELWGTQYSGTTKVASSGLIKVRKVG